MGFSTVRGSRLTLAISFASGCAFLLFGYDNGVMAGIINTNAFLSQFSYPSSTIIGLIVAIYNVGCFIGCMFAMQFGRKLGRRMMIIWSQWVTIVGAVLQSTAYTVPHLIVGRIITGIGTGMCTSTIPTWVSETSKAERRGALVAFQLAIVSAGILIAYWLDYGMLYATGQVVWRFPVAFQAVFSIATIGEAQALLDLNMLFLLTKRLLEGMVHFLPESPRLLYDWDRRAEADLVLSRLKDLPIDHPEVVEERQAILEAIELERHQPKMNIIGVFRDKSDLKLLRRVVIGFACQAVQQMTGIAVVVGYLPYVAHNQIGLPENLAQIMGGIAAVIYLIASFPPMLFVDRLGRRKCLMYGSAAMTTFWVLLIIFLSIGEERNEKGMLYAGIVCMYLYQIAFAFSWLSVPWIYPPEITPLKVRHVGAASSTSAEWLFAFLVQLVTPIGVSNISWRYYIVFACVCLASIPMVYFFFPETAGKTLEEIDFIFKTSSANDYSSEFSSEVLGDKGGMCHVELNSQKNAAYAV